MPKEISNDDPVADQSGIPIEDATIVAVKQEDVADLSRSQATETQAVAKLTDSDGNFAFSQEEIFNKQNEYTIFAIDENGELRGTPIFPHVSATGSTTPEDKVSREPNDNTFFFAADAGLVFTTSREWPDFQARIGNRNEITSNSRVVIEEKIENGRIEIASKDISSKSVGDVVTVRNVNLSADGKYFILLRADIDRSLGRFGQPTFPYESGNGLKIISSFSFNDPTSFNALVFEEIGNINL